MRRADHGPRTGLASDALGRSFRFRVAASTLRTIDHRGGLDAYLIKSRDQDLSPKALKVKRDLEKAAAEAAE